MATFSYSGPHGHGKLEQEVFDGYTRESSDVTQNGTDYYIIQVSYPDGSVRGTKTNRSTGETTEYNYSK